MLDRLIWLLRRRPKFCRYCGKPLRLNLDHFYSRQTGEPTIDIIELECPKFTYFDGTHEYYYWRQKHGIFGVEDNADLSEL